MELPIVNTEQIRHTRTHNNEDIHRKSPILYGTPCTLIEHETRAKLSDSG